MKAFPIVIDRETQLANDTNYAVQEDGMDLRDYFAAKAMQAMIQDWSDCHAGNARTAYQMADEMMKAR